MELQKDANGKPLTRRWSFAERRILKEALAKLGRNKETYQYVASETGRTIHAVVCQLGAAKKKKNRYKYKAPTTHYPLPTPIKKEIPPQMPKSSKPLMTFDLENVNYVINSKLGIIEIFVK